MKQEAQLIGQQKQKLLLSMAMTQSFQILQLPVLELAEWLKTEIEQNPTLEWEEIGEEADHHRGSTRFEIALPHTISLFEHLMAQANQHFVSESDRKIAEFIIGNLDEKGFLTDTELLKEESAEQILFEIQTFDPPGIAATSVQHSLLIQLNLKNKKSTLAYTLIKDHYDDLLQNRLPLLQKKLNCTLEELNAAIKLDIASLNLQPAAHFHPTPVQPLIPDIEIAKENDTLTIVINERPMPKFRLTSQYEQLVTLDAEEKKTVRQFTHSGKQLIQSVQKRSSTLRSIAEEVLRHHYLFMNGEADELLPLPVHETAAALNLSESTIARAISHKYLSCPKGIYSLKMFFSPAFKKADVSVHTAKTLLKKMVEEEDKKSPFSDEELAAKMSLHGIPCARRTVTKYRKHLNIGPASHRRQW